MSIERQLKHITDKADMHKTLDEMPEGACAFLVVRTTEENGKSSLDYAWCGAPSLWEAMGLLETAKQLIAYDMTHLDDEEEE